MTIVAKIGVRSCRVQQVFISTGSLSVFASDDRW